MADVLCSIIRQSGISDSGAAARASLHPSTVSRWKREFPDFAILLRSAREEFRAEQLELIMETARSGRSGGWRAAAWLLERTFPEDYSPRARERAQFQERFEAACAAEEEGAELVLPGHPAPEEDVRPMRPPGTPLQNVQNSDAAAPEEGARGHAAHATSDTTLPSTGSGRSAAPQHAEGRPLQNVQNSGALPSAAPLLAVAS